MFQNQNRENVSPNNLIVRHAHNDNQETVNKLFKL